MKYIDFLKLKQTNKIIRPYIISEAGVNHEGSMNTAIRLINETADAGSDSIKFQSYKAETIASKNSPSYWDTSKEPTKNQFDLFKKHDSFWKKEFEILKKECDKAKIEFSSTPFDSESAKFLNDLVSFFKISSSDLTNKPLIEQISSYNKPIILSTGASKIHEIQETLYWLKDHSSDVTLLHCILNYPTPNINAELGYIKQLSTLFPEYTIGYSDHTMPGEMDICLYSYIMGAMVIEKHFTHDKKLKGNDHYHAMNKEDLIKFNKKITTYLELSGDGNISNRSNEELARINARRSLYYKKDSNNGNIITESDIIAKRPFNGGIEPKYYDKIIGKKLNLDVKDDNQIKWSDFQ
jgi:sialic acid synthase SpsE